MRAFDLPAVTLALLLPVVTGSAFAVWPQAGLAQDGVEEEVAPSSVDALLEAEALAEAFRSSGWDAVEATEGEGGITIEARRGGAMLIAVRYDPMSGMVTAIAIENADGRPVLVPGATLTPAASL
ncbi:hypothetical protein LCM17_00390 [Cereibacter sphaeroides]|nr:hypothetical protein [Cereibacter sphaeroides]